MIDRLRLFLANPYKLRTLKSLFRGSLPGHRLIRRLRLIQPESLNQFLPSVSAAPAYFRQPRQPYFFFDPEDIPAIVASIPAPIQEGTLLQAEQFLTGRFAFRGSAPVVFSQEIHWGFVADKEPDWNRDLHRLDWLITLLLAGHYTGDPRFPRHVGAVLRHWWQENPLGSSPWREPFEVAQRLNTFSWLLFLGAPLEEFAADSVSLLICALLAGSLWLERNLEYQTPNNHLLIECLRLAQMGLLFPEFPGARRWAASGLGLLTREVSRQILPDGVHAELSTFYHRLVLEALLELIALARRNAWKLPTIIPDCAGKMLDFLQALAGPQEELPLLGDGFHRDTLLRYHLSAAGSKLLGQIAAPAPPDDRTLWLLQGRWPGYHQSKEPVSAQLWPCGGYAVLRRGTGGKRHRLIFDCGEFGLKAAPGHGHADCLSLDLMVFGAPVLVDPGTFSYKDETWRQAFRGTRAHNTVTVDGQNQTPLKGIFGAGPFATPCLNAAVLGSGLRLLDASHRGYERLPGRVGHRRSIIDLPAEGWLVIDSLTGGGQHQVEVLWHFHPSVEVSLSDASLLAPIDPRQGLAMRWAATAPLPARVHRGRESPPDGWVSREAGQKEAAQVLVLGGPMDLPARIVTLLTPFSRMGVRPWLRLADGRGGFAVTCEAEGTVTTVLLAEEGQPRAQCAPWATDARVAVIHTTPGERSFLLAGGSFLEYDGERWLSLAAPSSGLTITLKAADLHLEGELQGPVRIRCESTPRPYINGIPAKSFREENHLWRIEV